MAESSSSIDVGAAFLADARVVFAKQKRLAERALAQIADDRFFEVLGPAENSVAIILKHMAGNMRSRWRDFLTTDGEKPDRNRDAEFEHEGESRADVLGRWEQGWATLFAAIDGLGPDDLLREVRIRGEVHTVLQAINRQLDHYAYHVGQIVQLARHFAGEGWETLSIARRQSHAFSDGARKPPVENPPA